MSKCFAIDLTSGKRITKSTKRKDKRKKKRYVPYVGECDDVIRETKNQKKLCLKNVYNVYEIKGKKSKLKKVIK
jgi:hypothetical protein